MISELIKAFILIFIAEMGDKTQILAIAFATKYPVKKILIGVFVGSLLNHGLAVIFGYYLGSVIDFGIVKVVTGIAFVIFALWTLRIDEDEFEKPSKYRFGAVLTVSIAFFLGELGDKTQLAAVALA